MCDSGFEIWETRRKKRDSVMGSARWWRRYRWSEEEEGSWMVFANLVCREVTRSVCVFF